jgi:hypothetical protein
MTDYKRLDDSIARQAADAAAAKRTEALKKDLEDLLTKANAASREYTGPKYESLIKQWAELDARIAAVIRRFERILPCWPRIIECHFYPILNEIRCAEQSLYGDGTLPAQVQNLYDLQYWLSRNKEEKERRFNRIKRVLAAWEDPAATIDRILKDNKTLLETLDNTSPSAAGSVVVDLFLQLVPMHLAIAPPSGSAFRTLITKEYTSFCGTDTGKWDEYGDPDVGEIALRERLIGLQPSLIDPNDYFNLVQRLLQEHYGPAHEALRKAEAELSAADDRIVRLKAQLDAGLNKEAFEAAKQAIPSDIDCRNFETDKGGSNQTRVR